MNIIDSVTPPPALDEGENLLVREMSLEELGREMLEGRMRQSPAITAPAHVFDLRAVLRARASR